MNRLAALKQTELTRCAKAMQAAGIDVWTLEIECDGKMRIVVGTTLSLARRELLIVTAK